MAEAVTGAFEAMGKPPQVQYASCKLAGSPRTETQCAVPADRLRHEDEPRPHDGSREVKAHGPSPPSRSWGTHCLFNRSESGDVTSDTVQ